METMTETATYHNPDFSMMEQSDVKLECDVVSAQSHRVPTLEKTMIACCNGKMSIICSVQDK